MPPTPKKSGRSIREHLLGGRTTRPRIGSSHSESSRDRFGSEAEESDAFTIIEGSKVETDSKKETLLSNIAIGSRTLLFVTVVFGLLQTSKYIRRIGKWAYYTRRQKIIRASCTGMEYIFLIGSVLILMSCMKKPRRSLYFPVVFCWYLYVLVLGIPPWSPSCQDLFMIYLKYKDSDPNKSRQVQTLDCTFQGHTLVHFYMVWLLLSPRFMPGFKMMSFVNWFWIFVMYFGVSVWYREYSGDKFYSMSDIGVTIALLSFTNIIAMSKKYFLAKSQRSKHVAYIKEKEASEKMFRILEYMVPVHVIVPMLKKPGGVIAEPVNRVSILFIMIVDFDQFARSLSPEDLLAFLNRHFTLFDSLCQSHEVTKIETVGEEYVCAVGVVPADKDLDCQQGHAPILGRLVAVASDILRLQDNEVQYKMGVHTGPVVAGVIGQKLPRFRLFGDTINTAARMMQKGLNGQMQFGEETRRELPTWAEPLVKLRGEIEMKGKGLVTAYTLDRERMETERVRASIAFPARTTMATTRSRGSTAARVSFAREVDVVHLPRPRTSTGGSSGSSRPSIVDFALEATSDLAPHPAEAHSTALVEEVFGSEPRASDDPASGSRRGSASSSRRGSALSVGAPSRRGSVEPRSALKRPSEQSSAATSERTVRRTSCTIMHRNSETGDQQAQWMKQFEEALVEVSKTDGPETDMFGGRWVCSLGLGREHFSPEMEARWLQWFHDTTIVKKLADRLDKQGAALAIITAFDTCWMITSGAVKKGRGGQEFESYERWWRLPVFLVCRALSFITINAWRYLALSSRRERTADQKEAKLEGWIRENPANMQACLLFSSLFVAACLFMSYDAMAFIVPSWAGHEAPNSIEEIRWYFDINFSSKDNIYSLVCIPVYFLAVTQHPLLFYPSLCFLALSLWILSYDSLGKGYDKMNVYFSPPGKLLFVFASIVNSFLALEAEQNSRARFKATCTLKDTHERIEKILHTLMPPMVVEEIRDLPVNAPPPCHKYGCATIAQSDLVGFTKLASTRKAYQVVEFISELFGYFDELTDKHGIYKVETVGDAYIAGQADFPLTTQNKPCSVVLFGLDMVKKTAEWSRSRDLGVNCRVGVHSGECIGGIIGYEMQRYHLFGELMSGVEVLESTAPEGKVQASKECKEAAERQMRAEGLPSNYITFAERTGPHLTTSKGDVHQFEEVGGRTFVVTGNLEITAFGLL